MIGTLAGMVTLLLPSSLFQYLKILFIKKDFPSCNNDETDEICRSCELSTITKTSNCALKLAEGLHNLNLS